MLDEVHARSGAGVVSVVILTHQAGELVRRAVDSVLAQQGAEVELVVVDNASTDGTGALLDRIEASGSATVVRNPSNEGYARGMDRGVARTSGDLVVPMNCDAALAPDFAATALRLFAADPALGVAGAEIALVDEDGCDLDRSDGGVVALDHRGHVTCPAVTVAEAVSFKPNGACPVLRRALVDDVRRTFGTGPFDPVFDTYGEDVDLAYKAWSLRWSTRYDSSLRATHVRSYASPLEKQDKVGRLRTNLVAERYLNGVRHLPAARLGAYLRAAVVADAAMVVRRSRAGDTAVIGDVARGWSRSLRLLPSLLAFRRRHRTWSRIDQDREIHLADLPGWAP